jgi:hypothetical protein
MKQSKSKQEIAQATEIVNDRWEQLKEHQWRWEFIRRCPEFRKDCDPHQRKTKQFAFIDIWGLPHPGGPAASVYLTIMDFRGLLEGIAQKWITVEGMGIEEIARDIIYFAEAMSLKDVFAKDHAIISPIGINEYTVEAGDYRRYSKSMEITIMLPVALRHLDKVFLGEIENEYHILKSEVKAVGPGLYRFQIQTSIPKKYDEYNIRLHLMNILTGTINSKLEDVKHWNERERKKDYLKQIAVLDVLEEKKNKNDVLGKYEGNEDNYKKWKEQAETKIQQLEDAAQQRKLVFSYAIQP